MHLEFELQNGARGTVELSRTRTLRNTVIVEGSQGRIEVAVNGNEPCRVSPDELGRFVLDGHSAPMSKQPLFDLEIADWLDAIRNGGPPFVSGVQAMRTVSLIDECHRLRRSSHPAWTRIEHRRAAGGLTGRTVLVTGASGFIGSRLVEKLVLEGGAQVRAGVRNFSRAARVARLPAETVELRRHDLGAPEAVDAPVAGCDIVFHSAQDFTSAKVNEIGARAIGAACRRHGARLVYVGSVSVHQPAPDAPWTGTSTSGRNRRNYK